MTDIRFGSGGGAALDRAVAEVAPPFANAGIALARPGAEDLFACASAEGAPTLTPDAILRAASITKVVTGQAVWSVLAEHPGALDADCAEIFGPALRPPVTARHLLAHTSGLWDEGDMPVPSEEPLPDWLARARGIWSPDGPGQVQRYCNLGWVIAAAAAERLAGAPLDRIVRGRILEPLGISAGLNWSGLDADTRRRALPILRRHRDGRFEATVDNNVPPAGVALPDGAVIDVSGLAPGTSAHAFSPQGGLRISLTGALRLAQALPRMARDVLWAGDRARMDDPSGAMERYGPGLMLLDRPGFYPRPLIGHFANAYGFKGGIWFDAEHDAAFVIALNGRAFGDDDDALDPAEGRLFAAVAEALG